MNRIGVTGANGYLGGRLIDYLSSLEEYKIIPITRQIESQKNSPNQDNGEEIVHINWKDEKSLNDICKKLDVIIHCAGMNAQDCVKYPIESFEFNGITTGRLAKIASENGVSKFIYVSTAHVYSSPLVGNYSENNFPLNQHPYASSHRLGEDLSLYFSENTAMKTIVIRLTNSFGKPMNKQVNCWQLLVNDLCKQAIEKNLLTLNTSGLQRRDFVTITEVTKVIAFLLRTKLDNQNLILNLAGKWSPTILEMAELIQSRINKLFNKKIELERKQNSPTELILDLNIETLTLDKLGYQISQNPIEEIDNLLGFCSENFERV